MTKWKDGVGFGGNLKGRKAFFKDKIRKCKREEKRKYWKIDFYQINCFKK